MQKNKANVFVITLIIIFSSFTGLNYVYAKNNEIVDYLVVTITNDAKEINDTHKIEFKVEKNKDVVTGKIAPGMKATAEIEINLKEVTSFVDIEVKIDDSNLNKAFKINTKLDEKTTSTSKISKIEAGSIRKLEIELIWNENNIENTIIGNNAETIDVPIQIKVLQHI